MKKKTKQALLSFASDLQTNLAAGWIAAAVASLIIKDWNGLLLSTASATVASYISISIRRKV